VNTAERSLLLERLLELRRQRNYPELERQIILADVRLHEDLDIALQLTGAWIHLRRYQLGIQLTTQLLESTNPRNDPSLIRKLYLHHAHFLNDLGRIVESRHEAMRCISIDPSAVDPTLANAHNLLGVICGRTGDWADSVAHFQRALARYQVVGWRLGVAAVNHNIGMTLTNKGHLEEAERHFLAAEEFYAIEGNPYEKVMCASERALAVLGLGDIDRASGLAEHAYEICIAIESKELLADVQRVRGMIQLRAEKLPSAKALLLSGLSLAVEIDNWHLRAEIEEVFGALEFELGETTHGEELLRSSLAYFESIGGSFYSARITEKLNNARLKQA
jgi:hypothetical protein